MITQPRRRPDPTGPTGSVRRQPFEHARSRGDRVDRVLHGEPGSDGPFDARHGHVRLMPGLDPHNAFTTTNLAHLLTTWGTP